MTNSTLYLKEILDKVVPDERITRILEERQHDSKELRGWSGIISLSAIDEDNSWLDIDIRYAYGDQIFNQNLVDHGYFEEMFINQAKLNRRKLIIYLCDPNLNIQDGKRSADVEQRYIIGKRWNNLRHVYFSINSDKDLWKLIPKEITRVFGYATKPVNLYSSVFNEKKNDNRLKLEGGLRKNGIFKSTQVDKPLISVITPVFNNILLLEQTIQSVINQSYDNVEYIIIDADSNDGTIELIKKYENFIDYWISEPDKGIFYGYDKGITLSTGSFIGTINSDDFYSMDAIEKIVKTAVQYPYMDYFHGDMFNIKLTGNVERKSGDLKGLNKTMTINYPTLFFKKSTYQEIGGFDLKIRICADYEFMLKLKKYERVGKKITEVLAFFRQGGISYLNFKKYREVFYCKKKYDILDFSIFLQVIKYWPYKLLVKIFGMRKIESLKKLF